MKLLCNDCELILLLVSSAASAGFSSYAGLLQLLAVGSWITGAGPSSGLLKLLC